MTPSNRRTIAVELRRVASDSLDGESLNRALARITCAEDSSWRGVMRRLADLIDLPATSCEKCGGEWPLDIRFEYCPYCGAKVIDE